MAQGGWQGAGCPRCGSPLRWAPEHGQWFCDREQQWIHPSALQPQHPPQPGYPQPGYPQPGYPQQPYGQPAPGGGRGRAWILIVVAVLGIAVASVFLVLRGGDGPKGAASPEDLAAQALEALAAKDPKALMRLGGGKEVFASVSDCPPDMLDEAELMWMRQIRRTRTDELALEKATLGKEIISFDEGDEMGDDCQATRTFAVHRIDLELASEDADEAHIFAVQIDERWYLSAFDGLPDRDLSDEELEEEEEYERAYRAERLAEKRKNLDVPDSAGAGAPEDILEELVRSLEKGDSSHARKLVPDDSIIELVFDCDEDSELHEELSNTRDTLRDGPDEPIAVTVDTGKTVVDRGEALELGARFRDCTVAGPVTVGRVEGRVAIKDGSIDDDFPLKLDILEIGGRWFLLEIAL